jgi:signal transduction histidine kinase/ActR/RegA family two-component response regulator
VALAGTTWLCFLGGITSGLGQVSVAYIVFPFVIWAALRFGQPVTTTVTLITSGIAIWGTLNDFGPFGSGPLHERLLLLQMFMGVVAITALLLGASLSERKRVLATLQEAAHRKDVFLATLAHELRNPLSTIRSGIDLMRVTDLEGSASGEVLDMLDRQMRQMTRLIDDLLDVSRITRGKVQLQFKLINLANVILRAVETSQPLLDAHGQKVSVNWWPEPLYLHADGTRLAQAFTNLLNNSAKYSERGGHITVEMARESDEAVVKVRDTGCGIDPDLLPHIFDLFTQGEPSGVGTGSGLGIGLTLVRSIVEMHGGTVQCYSEGRGLGSEFVVRLPINRDAPIETVVPAANDQKQPDSTNSGHRVLVVDDNLDAARSLTMLLQSIGFEVRVANTGTAALDLISTFRPEVVLLDIGLPEMDGYEVARRIRGEPLGVGIALVAVTGWGQADDRQRALEAGFNQHLTKPVEFNVLKDLLGRLMEKTP